MQETQHNYTIQYNTIQYNTIQYNTIQYNTIENNTYILLDGWPANMAGYFRESVVFWGALRRAKIQLDS